MNELTIEEHEQIKRDTLDLLLHVKRKGIKQLIDYLETSDYFICPASTKHHSAYPGGLAKHSLWVFSLMDENLQALEETDNIPRETIIICSLLHDVGAKVGAYIKTKDGYKYNPSHPKGHAKLSIDLIEKYIKLTDLEKQIIKYHMGYYGTVEFSKQRGEYTLQELSNAQNNKYVKLFHWCDDMETQFYK